MLAIRYLLLSTYSKSILVDEFNDVTDITDIIIQCLQIADGYERDMCE